MSCYNAYLYRDLYAWFTAALYLPVEDIFSPAFIQTIRELSHRLNLDFQDDILRLQEETKGQGNELLKKLQIEHSRLFVGPFALPSPPYESYYKEKGKVMGQCTMEVLHYYRQEGMEVSDDFKDAPDHIVLETNFLSELCRAEYEIEEMGQKEMARKKRQKQRLFLRDHLLTWSKTFLKHVEESAEINFYPAVLRMLNQAAKNHLQQLIIQEPEICTVPGD